MDEQNGIAKRVEADGYCCYRVRKGEREHFMSLPYSTEDNWTNVNQAYQFCTYECIHCKCLFDNDYPMKFYERKALMSHQKTSECKGFTKPQVLIDFP